jgi:lysophospholipase
MTECRAVILHAFGSGNLPVKEEGGVLEALKRAVEKEILVVVISQCESCIWAVEAGHHDT